jgi:hypothetical protein
MRQLSNAFAITVSKAFTMNSELIAGAAEGSAAASR